MSSIVICDVADTDQFVAACKKETYETNSKMPYTFIVMRREKEKGKGGGGEATNFQGRKREAGTEESIENRFIKSIRLRILSEGGGGGGEGERERVGGF